MVRTTTDKLFDKLGELEKQIHDLEYALLKDLKEVLKESKSLIKPIPIEYAQGQMRVSYGKGVYVGTKTLEKMPDYGKYDNFFYTPSSDGFIAITSEEKMKGIGINIHRLFTSFNCRALEENEAIKNINMEKIINNLKCLQSSKAIKFSADREDTNFAKYWGLDMRLEYKPLIRKRDLSLYSKK